MNSLRQAISLIAATATMVLPAGAQETPAPKPAKVSVQPNAVVVSQHRPGTWSILGLNAVNTGDEAGETMLSVYFEPNSQRQFARRMWVPAQAKRTSWLPVQIPAKVVGDRVAVTTLTLETSGDRELLKRRFAEPMASNVLMAIDRGAPKTAIILRTAMPDEYRNAPALDDDLYMTTTAARLDQNLPRNFTDLTGDFIPPWPEVFAGLDQIVLSSDQIAGDDAGVVALRAWVREGGRLWMAMDRISPATLAAILGNAIDLQFVDRVELDRYTIETTTGEGRPPLRDDREFETPVELVRVVTSAGDVPSRIDGWPAAIWLPYGEGEVLLTLLGPRGWLRETNESTEGLQAGKVGPTPTDICTEALRTVSSRFFALPRETEEFNVRGLQPALEQQIGYRIPKRSLATAVLGGHCLALLGAGAWLARRGRLDWLAVLVPSVAVAAAASLLAVGASNAASVPPMIAFTQILRVAPQTNEVRVDGLAAIYDQESRPIEWRTRQGSWLLPEATGAEVRRQIWTDDGTQSQNAATRASSVSLASFSGTVSMAQAISAEGSFGPQGLAGRIVNDDLADIADPVIVGAIAPALAVAVSGDGTFKAAPEQTLAADQYSGAAILSNLQRQRQDVCRWLFDPTDPLEIPSRPSLAFWRRPIDAGLELPAGFEQAGWALAIVPIELRPTPPDSPFRIPATFLRPQVVPGRQGTSHAYQARTGEWIAGLTIPTETVLRHQLPRQVLPCRLERGTLTVRINAPMRDMEIWAYGTGEPTLVRKVKSPNGAIEIDLGADQLTFDAAGGVRIGISISETENERAENQNRASKTPVGVAHDNSPWQIDYVRLTVDGRTDK